MHIYPWTHGLCNMEIIRMWKKMSKWEVVMFALRAHMRVLIPITIMVITSMQIVHENQ